MKKDFNAYFLILCCACTVFITSAFSQDIEKPESLKRHQESQKSERNKMGGKSREFFTILLVFTDDKDVAEQTKRRFETQFVDKKYPTLVEWHEPKFKVFAGAFNSRAEAVSLLYKTRLQFPNAMIVKNRL
jgi:hypothetical protein